MYVCIYIYIYIYIYLKDFNTENTYAKTGNASFLCLDKNQTSSNRAN